MIWWRVLMVLVKLTPAGSASWLVLNDTSRVAASLIRAGSLFGAALAVTVVFAVVVFYGMRVHDARVAQYVADNTPTRRTAPLPPVDNPTRGTDPRAVPTLVAVPTVVEPAPEPEPDRTGVNPT